MINNATTDTTDTTTELFPDLAPADTELFPGLPPAAAERAMRGRRYDVHDFDFLAGARWNVVNRRLVQRGVGSTTWDEFPATHSGAIQHLGGLVNVDEMDCPTRGWAGMAVRAFHRETARWRIYWIDSRTGAMYPPVEGGFVGPRGELYGDDDDAGRPVKVRYVWTIASPASARWEQAFSYDGGPWEVNWTMDFTREAA